MAYRKTTLYAPDYTLIPGGLNIGSQIIIRGRIPHGEERFAINLQNGEEDGSDIAFHFNPRNGEQTVVRNSFQDGGWQGEERDIPYFPFTNGSKFTVRIFVSAEAYVVMVNGQFFLEYNHRLSYQDVRCLLLTEGAEYYEATVQNKCRTPYIGEFSGGLRSGKALRVRGCVNDDAERFAINFNCDPNGETVGVHFNPRQDEEDVVMNSLVGGDWGSEERGHGSFPFERGTFFDVLFVTYHDTFKIYVNDRYFTSYAFRVPPEDIYFLQIVGDATLMDVEFTDPLSSDFVKTVPSGLEKHDMISVKGFFNPEGDRFHVNLLYGTGVDDDVALHFNPRRGEGEVVLNSREEGEWMDEERHSLPSVFQEMIPFNVEIINKGDKFKLYVNGRKLSSFRCRGNVEDIRGINAGGDAYIYEVKLLRRVDIPFVDRIPSQLEPGSWISLIGTPDEEASTFAINLQTGDDTSYDSDVALHFNPRFNEDVTVRNSLLGGCWGEEERHQPHFPFEQKDRFEINILVTPEAYRIFVNGQRHVDYPHRIGVEAVSHLMLTGECDFFEPECY